MRLGRWKKAEKRAERLTSPRAKAVAESQSRRPIQRFTSMLFSCRSSPLRIMRSTTSLMQRCIANAGGERRGGWSAHAAPLSSASTSAMGWLTSALVEHQLRGVGGESTVYTWWGKAIRGRTW